MLGFFLSGPFSQLFFVALVAFCSIGLPAIKRSASQAKRQSRIIKRNPRDFGSISLDGVRISERGKGVLNPDNMYSETNKTR